MSIEDEGIIVPDLPTEEAKLDYTNNLRLMMVSSLTNNGRIIPTDADGVVLLNDLLTSVDRQALARMKMRIDTQESNEDRRVALMVAHLNKGIVGDPYRLTKPMEGHQPVIDVTAFEEIVVPEYATEQGITSEQYVDFARKFAE